MNGFRYNARVLAEHLAQSLGVLTRARRPIADAVSFLLRELSVAPELWVQKGYLCRVATRDGAGFVDNGVLPLAHFLDATDGDAVAASVEVDERGAIVPMLYVRRKGAISEHAFESHPLHDYESDPYRREITPLVR